MNLSLVNNRHKSLTKEEFEKAWKSNTVCFDALELTLKEWMNELSTVKKNDFDCPNHYAKLAYQAGMLEGLSKVLELLPKPPEA